MKGLDRTRARGGRGPPRGLCWIWPLRHSHATGKKLWRIAGIADPLCASWHWAAAVVAIGLVPLGLCYCLGIPAHQQVTALLLFPLFVALVRADRQWKAVATIALVFGLHSVLAISLSAIDPTGSARVNRHGAEYWEANLRWIRSGEDPEYEIMNWLPAHFRLLAGMAVFSFCSLGFVSLLQGLYEVDLMNYYVGRLLVESHSQTIALMAGWHIWSILRGIAYTFLVYEFVSLSLQRISGVTLSTPRRRYWRLGVGLFFFLCDCVIKYFAVEPVREHLFRNLVP